MHRDNEDLHSVLRTTPSQNGIALHMLWIGESTVWAVPGQKVFEPHGGDTEGLVVKILDSEALDAEDHKELGTSYGPEASDPQRPR